MAGRRAHLDAGLYHKPGDFGNLPAGEVSIAPLEGTGKGKVVIDGSMIDLLKRKILLTIKNGVITKIRGCDKLVRILNEAGPNSKNLAEFGIGTNPNARVIGNVLEDEKALGTCHIALGDSSVLGGTVRVGTHIDGVILKPMVKLDGKILMKNGRFVFK